MTTTSTATPVVVTLVDDGDLAIAGLQSLLAPYAGRVQLVDIRAALAAPDCLDVILYEPVGQSTMGQSLLRDLQGGGAARAAVFSWASPDQLPLRPTSPCLSKTLTASQLVVALEGLAVDRDSDRVPDQLSEAVTIPDLRVDGEAIEVEESGPEEGAAARPSASRYDDDLPIALTPREHDVLLRIVGGLSNREISAELELSLNSVKTYVRSAYRKIGVIRRTQAVLWGVNHGLGDVVVSEQAGTDELEAG